MNGTNHVPSFPRTQKYSPDSFRRTSQIESTGKAGRKHTVINKYGMYTFKKCRAVHLIWFSLLFDSEQKQPMPDTNKKISTPVEPYITSTLSSAGKKFNIFSQITCMRNIPRAANTIRSFLYALISFALFCSRILHHPLSLRSRSAVLCHKTLHQSFFIQPSRPVQNPARCVPRYTTGRIVPDRPFYMPRHVP